MTVAPRARPLDGVRLPAARSGPNRIPIGVATILGSMFLAVRLPLNLAPVDVLLFVTYIVGFAALARRDVPLLERHVRWMLPSMYALAIATVATWFRFGVPIWSLDHAVRDLITPFAFSVSVAYLWPNRDRADVLLRAWLVALAVVATSTLIDASSGARTAGLLFRNENYPAHALAIIATLVVLTPGVRRPVKIAVGVVALAGMIPTGSFGAYAIPMGSGTYWLISRSQRIRGTMRIPAMVLVTATMSIFLVQGLTAVDSATFDLGSGFNSNRLERSGEVRFKIWGSAIALLADHPQGVGPRALAEDHSLDAAKTAESHNDYVAFLVETGVLGILAYLGVLTAVFLAGTPGGPTRALLVGLATSGVFREVVNFRHPWLALATAFLLEQASVGQFHRWPFRASTRP